MRVSHTSLTLSIPPVSPPLFQSRLISNSLPPSAAPRQCIDLFFDEKYLIEPSWECKFDHIEVRDGPFGFSPIIGRYCGQESPAYVRSTGRYLYIKFVADGELEAIGFSARYNFTQGEWLQGHLDEGTACLNMALKHTVCHFCCYGCLTSKQQRCGIMRVVIFIVVVYHCRWKCTLSRNHIWNH